MKSSNYEETWQRYASSWGAKSVEEKKKLYAQSLDEECVYTDPLTQCRGWDALMAYMVEFHEKIPGGSFRTVEFITHNDRSLARWEMLDGSGSVVGVGASYGEFTDSGKLRTMTGFFDVPDGSQA